MTEYLDHPPADWFVFEVLPENEGGQNWVAFLIDVPPDDFVLHRRPARSGCFRIPGEHESRDAAWDALEDLMATRH
jgi:hypothetical protein